MIFGKYQLLELIGRGGMAEVFKAKSYGVEGFEKLLVIKRILPMYSHNDAFVEMFINEAKIAVSLNHANVVQIFDLGKAGDAYYIAMEYVMGLDLASLLRRSAAREVRMPAELAVYIAAEVAKGLDYAHRRRGADLLPLHIVHRDISPHNILISFEGEVKVTDFGIARARFVADGGQGVQGKHFYMAPEQAEAASQDFRVDIFSLGVVLCELLTHANPFQGLTPAAAQTRMRAHDYPMLTSAETGLPRELVDIVLRALAPNPDDRYADAAAFYEALLGWLYASGTRVGAHGVAAFIQPFRHSAETDPLTESDGDAVSSPSSPSHDGAYYWGTDASLSGAAGWTSPVDDAFWALSAAPLPVTERRWIAALSVSLPASHRGTAYAAQVQSFVASFGGTPLPDTEGALVYLFGATHRVSTPLLLAAVAAFALRDAQGESHFLADVPALPMGLAHGAVSMRAGELVRDAAWRELVTQAQRVASSTPKTIALAGALPSGMASLFDAHPLDTGATEGDEDNAGGDTVPQMALTACRAASASGKKFIGRREALRALGEQLARASQGRGHVVAVDGDAGVGKTRVFFEVRRRLEAGGHGVNWYHIGAKPWQRGVAYAGLAALFRSIIEAAPSMSVAALSSRLAVLRELALSDEEMWAVMNLLGAPLPDDVPVPEPSRWLPSALVRAVRQLSRDRLTVLFVDDLHFLDGPSLRALHHLSRHIPRASVLVAFAIRTGCVHGFETSPDTTFMTLPPFSDEDSRRLVRSYLDGDVVEEAAMRALLTVGGGNPQRLHACLQIFRHRGLSETRLHSAAHLSQIWRDIPLHWHAVMLADLHLLPAPIWTFLQHAAVVGANISPALLSRITEMSEAEVARLLTQLTNMGFLRDDGGGAYAFSVPIVQDTLYHSMALPDRHTAHLGIAQALEEVGGDSPDEAAVAAVASHYARSSEPAKAVPHLLRCLREHRRNTAYRAALASGLQALDILAGDAHADAALRLDLYVEIGGLVQRLNAVSHANDIMPQALLLARQEGDQRAIVQLCEVLGSALFRTDQGEAAVQTLAEGTDVADALGDVSLRVGIRLTTAQMHLERGELAQAAALCEAALSLATATDAPEWLFSARLHLAMVLAESGDVSRAQTLLDESAALQCDAQASTAWRPCLLHRAWARLYWAQQKRDEAIEQGELALEIALQGEWLLDAMLIAGRMGEMWIAQNDHRKAFSYFQRAREMALEAGDAVQLARIDVFLHYIDAVNFGSDEGVAHLQEALQRAEQRGEALDLIILHGFLGNVLAGRRQKHAARRHWDAALSLATATQNHIWAEMLRAWLAEWR
ncbi:MAG: protein kinase [Proteobacteria bacterium]|nr:protein kinase [Pseudomonadota bacterium]